jgi:hypothetical protein
VLVPAFEAVALVQLEPDSGGSMSVCRWGFEVLLF